MRPRSGKGRNSAERAPTTSFALFSATARQMRPRKGADTPECHSAGRAPKRSWQRAMNWLVSAISGINTSTCLPRDSAAAIASK